MSSGHNHRSRCNFENCNICARSLYFRGRNRTPHDISPLIHFPSHPSLPPSVSSSANAVLVSKIHHSQIGVSRFARPIPGRVGRLPVHSLCGCGCNREERFLPSKGSMPSLGIFVHFIVRADAMQKFLEFVGRHWGIHVHLQRGPHVCQDRVKILAVTL